MLPVDNLAGRAAPPSRGLYLSKASLRNGTHENQTQPSLKRRDLRLDLFAGSQTGHFLDHIPETS